MGDDDDEQWEWARSMVRTWPQWSAAQWRAVNATLGYDVAGAPRLAGEHAPAASPKGSGGQAQGAA